MRVAVKQVQQRERLLRTLEICGKPVTVSEVWSVARRSAQQGGGDIVPPAVNDYAQAAANGQILGVVYAVPVEFTPEQIRDMTAAVSARRLTPPSNKEEVYSVLLSFTGVLPQHVQLTPFIKLKVFPYSLRPMQCRRCWAFGHTQRRCLGQQACEYCSRKGHTKAACSVLNQAHQCRCINCKGPHKATSKLCVYYQKNLNILRLASTRTPSLSFREARELYQCEKQSAQVSNSVLLPAQSGERLSYAAAVALATDSNTRLGTLTVPRFSTPTM